MRKYALLVTLMIVAIFTFTACNGGYVGSLIVTNNENETSVLDLDGDNAAYSNDTVNNGQNENLTTVEAEQQTTAQTTTQTEALCWILPP